MLVIIDYKVGNLTSILNMLNKIGCSKALISDQTSDIEKASHLIIPGVGHFDYGMRQLRSAPFFEVMNRRVLEDKIPVLGICLGAQLLLDGSEEGSAKGLGWIAGSSKRFEEARMPKGFKIPHMGWSNISPLKDSALFKDLPEDPRFYFVHSYHMQCANPEYHACAASYGYDFIAAVEKDNIYGVQFHPEKSHKYGMKLLHNFISLSGR